MVLIVNGLYGYKLTIPGSVYQHLDAAMATPISRYSHYFQLQIYNYYLIYKNLRYTIPPCLLYL